MIPFIITIDTEGDNLWSKPFNITTNNAKGLVRFQNLCNEYGYKPVYLTNYEMSNDSSFVKFAKETLSKSQCEIGMHLHPWNSPPAYSLTNNDLFFQPFLMEYPTSIIEEKVAFITNHLQNIFETNILSHRAGRWGMNETYYHILEKFSYHTDCSVTPYVDWSKVKGNPKGKGGTNFTRFPSRFYFPDRFDLSKEGSGKILEVPVTIVLKPRFIFLRPLLSLREYMPRLLKRLTCKTSWLRPVGDNLSEMLSIIKNNSNMSYLEFMIHSSELSPGLSPLFQTDASIEKLFSDLKVLFKELSKVSYGSTLEEFYQSVIQK